MSASVSMRLLQTRSDDRLITLARHGDERAFEVLVQRYRPSLIAYGRRLLPAARAEDAVQQGLFQAWLALQRGTEVRDVRPWLYQIVRNSALRLQRASGREHAPLSEAFASAQTPDSELESRLAARDALASVAALPGLQREAMLQTAIAGRTHDQVAATLGLSDGAVRGLLYRARTTLRSARAALTPFPLVTWAVHAARTRVFTSKPLLEVGSGAGGAGYVAVLVKGGAIALTAGALVVGGAAVHLKLWPREGHASVHGQTPAGSIAQRHLTSAESEFAAANGFAAFVTDSRLRSYLTGDGRLPVTGSRRSGRYASSGPLEPNTPGADTGPVLTTQSSTGSAGNPDGQGSAGSSMTNGPSDGATTSGPATVADAGDSNGTTSTASSSSESSMNATSAAPESSGSSTTSTTPQPGDSTSTTSSSTPPPGSDSSGASLDTTVLDSSSP